jgi:hypothetical protein
MGRGTLILNLRRRSIRLKGYDYAQAGAYFITIVTHLRKMVFGNIVDEKVLFSQIGQIAVREWVKLAQRFALVDLDEFVVMQILFMGLSYWLIRVWARGLGTNDHLGIIPVPRQLKPARLWQIDPHNSAFL